MALVSRVFSKCHGAYASKLRSIMDVDTVNIACHLTDRRPLVGVDVEGGGSCLRRQQQQQHRERHSGGKKGELGWRCGAAGVMQVACGASHSACRPRGRPARAEVPDLEGRGLGEAHEERVSCGASNFECGGVAMARIGALMTL
jgi:hypothetical protein